MSFPPDIDPYSVLGVLKDATVPEIKTAHRKRVLKCHPDKIQDESQRSQAQDEFQQVQQAYELLSDPARRIKYDQKVRLAELRKEKMDRAGDSSAYSSPRASAANTAWECRDGRIYEERTPADGYFDDEARFTQEPRPMSRKHEDFSRRRSKGADEKRRSKGIPLNTFHVAREMLRDNAKASHSSRAKYRTKERKREAYEKYERAAYVESDDGSDSSAAPFYDAPKRSPEPRRRSDASRRTRTKESSRRRDFRDYDDNDYSDEWESTKHDYLHTSARDYILRSRGSAPVDIDPRHRSSQSPLRHRGYESAGPDTSSRRSRPSRSSKDTDRRSTSRSGSYEHLDSPRSRDAKTPTMPTAATSQGVKIPPFVRPSLQSTRSATTTGYSRSKRDSPSRPESNLYNMVYNDPPPRSSKRRDRYDSGYSSPGTPEVQTGTSPPKAPPTRYKIVTEPETILVDPEKPSSSRRQRVSSPPRQERPPLSRTGSKPTRSSTYAYPADSSARYENKRPSLSRTNSSRPFFGEVEFGPRLKGRDVKYAREIGPDDIIYTNPRHHYDDYRPPVGRRQTTYA